MGCNFSSEPVKVVEPETSASLEEENSSLLVPDSDKRSSLAKSHDSFISGVSVESDRSSDILAPHRSKSIDLSRNGSANRDDPPVATATIIRGPSGRSRKGNTLDVPLPHQVEEALPPSDITLTPPQNEARDTKNSLSKRRRSDGDVGKVTSVTCIPRSLVKSNPLLNSGFQEIKAKPSLFGPRNSHLTLSESQKDFFKMLDDKVAQGKDYCSEDDKSLASFHSASLIHRKGSNESNGIMMSPIPQHVR